VMGEIKAVLFDLYGTLVYEERDEEEQYRFKAYNRLIDYLKSLGYNVSINYFIKIYNNIFEKCLERIKGTLNELDMIYVYWNIFKNLGIIPSLNLVKNCLDIFYTMEVRSVKIFPDTLSILNYCRKRSFKTAIVSNATIRFEYVISHLKLSNYFDVLMASYKILKVKPHPEIYLKTLNLLNISPQNAVMIGNSPLSDIIGAKKVGLKAILVKRHDIEENIFQKYNVYPDAIIFSLNELRKLI